MSYLVTGGTGLIGSRIVRDLSREGEQVVVYDLFPDRSILEQLLNEEERTRVRIVQGDVTDLPHLMTTVKENNVEKIFHMAYLLTHASAANPSLAIKVNCEGTSNIFETARILGLKRVIWARGHNEQDAPISSPTVYTACKRLNLVLAEHYFQQYGVEIVDIEFPLTYGAWQRTTGGSSASIVRELVENPALGKPGRVPFGDDIVEWAYVDDSAKGSLLASKMPITKTRHFTVIGDLRALKEVADCVRKLLPGAEIDVLPGGTGFIFKPRTMPVNKESEYRYQWSVEQGIKEVINILRRQHGLPQV